MKKRIAIIFSLMLLVIVGACSKGSPYKQATDVLNEATEKISAMKTGENIEQISNETMKKVQDILQKEEYRPKPEEEAALEEAMANFFRIVLAKSMESTYQSVSAPSEEPAKEEAPSAIPGTEVKHTPAAMPTNTSDEDFRM